MALLDLDPGQPEFSPPGRISLNLLGTPVLGPPYVHPVLPPRHRDRVIRSHFFGSLTPRNDPLHYMDCARDLYHHYQELILGYPKCPLVVNCSGWIQGEGVDILRDLVQLLSVDDLILMKSGIDDVSEDLIKVGSNVKAKLHLVNSILPQVTLKSSSELRAMQSLSYFHISEPEAEELHWNALPLTSQSPCIFHYAGMKQNIFAVMILGEALNPQFFEVVLDGTIVDLVVLENDAALAPFEKAKPETIARDHDDSLSQMKDAADEIESNNENQDGIMNTENLRVHFGHKSILRTPSQIPYLESRNSTTRPFSPRFTYSLGQALIHSIDASTCTFRVYTPIPASTFNAIHQERRKIVLVRGDLDTPTWAYEEAIEYEKARRKGPEEEMDGREETTGEKKEDMGDFVHEIPWADNRGDKGSKGTRRRSGRRDLKYRSQARSDREDRN